MSRRIYYVVVRCGDHGPTLEVTASECICDNPVDGAWASDRIGVAADFAFLGPSPTAHY